MNPFTRIITKPVVCITFPRTEHHAQNSADIVRYAPTGIVSLVRDLIARVETKFPGINCMVEYRDNQPLITMSRSARRACNATDAEIAAAAGFQL